jgi:hypothetical protein
MKKITTYTIALLLTLFGCAEFTEIEPKGKNLLGTVADLDQLLNYRYAGGTLAFNEFSVLVNDLYPQLENIPNMISAPVKTLNSILLTWDDTEDRAALTQMDYLYEGFYSIIGKVANPVLLMADDVTGDRDLANRLKAEAYVLRAYFHYLLVNIFAKAYDPATAATDGGIPYAKENDQLSAPNPKYTVQKVYDFILDDLQAAHDLNALPNEPANLMRVGKAFAYAVEAKVRMSMRTFPGAATAAANALVIRNTVEDHRNNLVAGTSMLGVPGDYFTRPEIQSPEDYFYVSSSFLLYNGLTQDLSNAFENGHIFYKSVEKLNAYASMFYGMDCDLLFSQKTYLNAYGLSTVDMLLVQAECKLRDNDVTGAMAILNDLRAKRVEPYTAAMAANAAEAFALLKKVSRTEGWLGPRNFINLKRWNTEDAYKETLTKTLLGNTYSLPPNSPLWVFPFPQNATGYNPNLTQNY